MDVHLEHILICISIFYLNGVHASRKHPTLFRTTTENTKTHIKVVHTQRDRQNKGNADGNNQICGSTWRRQAVNEHDVIWDIKTSASSRGSGKLVNRDRRHSLNEGKQRGLLFKGNGEILEMSQNQLFSENGEYFPSINFTVSVWLKPEGGFGDRIDIISFHDVCVPRSSRGWTFGIMTDSNSQMSGAKYFFSLSPDRVQTSTILTAPSCYDPGRWSQLTATYDGETMIFYVNSARVGMSNLQKGHLFSSGVAECKALVIGGNLKAKSFYRGTLSQLQIWQRVLSQDELMSVSVTQNDDGILVNNNLEQVHNLWQTTTSASPDHEDVDRDHVENDDGYKIPPCGQTVCDDPDVVHSYVHRWQLRRDKVIRYQIMNIYDDNGTNPLVTQEQINTQEVALRSAFKKYNISWLAEEVEIRNSTLRSKTIIYQCDPGNVGDGICQLECNHNITGNDGGDCDETFVYCEEDNIGDGECQEECNRYIYDWDGGDCCLHQTSSQCVDPQSSNRSYISVEEYKAAIGMENKEGLNIYLAQWTSDVMGVATFPWDPKLYTVQGGVVVRPDAYGTPGKTLNLVHELGHVLGLWHVHIGVSEMGCGDPCRENEASMKTGDLCSDTRPTPINYVCSDPSEDSWDSSNQCEAQDFTGTPYRNYMGYTGDGCADYFSKQQVARMHCYLDLKYQTWTRTQSPSPIPLQPKIVKASPGTMTMTWQPAIGGGSGTVSDVCSSCLNDNSLLQYANHSSSLVSLGFGDFGPDQAVGPPDAVTCQSNFAQFAWVPHGPTGPCVSDSCYIELHLQYPVIASRLFIWLPYVEKGVIRDVELVYEDGRSSSLGQISAYCDMPYTARLTNQKNRIKQINIRGRGAAFAVDALAVLSNENSAWCKKCPPIEYRVTREPRFQDETDQSYVITSDTTFTDRGVAGNVEYLYTVEAVSGNDVGLPSPALSYTQEQSFCGDGIINRTEGEQCDDNNLRNRDGCSINCITEDDFICSGEPSLCYLYVGDGVCEELEDNKDIIDCRHQTPVGFSDQWAVSASAGPGGPDPYSLNPCDPDVVTGPPAWKQTCGENVDNSIAWNPSCLSHHSGFRKYWLEVEFHQPAIASAVILYIHGDQVNQNKPVDLHLDLIGLDSSRLTSLDITDTFVCRMRVVTANISHDLTQPLRKTKAVRIQYTTSLLYFHGVALRTADWLNDIGIAMSCDGASYYSKIHNSCVPRNRVCHSASCTSPAVKHADVTCSGYSDGHSCEVNCKPGYSMIGNGNILTCVNGSWTGEVHCQPVDCGQPVVPYGIPDCPDGTTYGEKCKFDCSTPARKQGSSNTIMCQEDGLWSLLEGYCRILCLPLTRLKNSTVVDRFCMVEAQDLGTRCTLRCDKGFKVKNREGTGRTYGLQCGSDGTWEGDTCERIICSDLPDIYTGTYSCSDKFNAGSTCTIKCPESDATSTVKCQRNGEWDRNPIACQVAATRCPDLNEPEASPGLVAQCSNNTVGSKCQISCEFPGHDVLSVDEFNMDTSGSVIRSLVCTLLGDWYPRLMDIQCLPKCDPYFIGDGYCDPSNNQARCSWDGGDCCRSTSSTGLLVSCGSACRCKDPNAEENQNLGNRIRRHHNKLQRRKRLQKKKF